MTEGKFNQKKYIEDWDKKNMMLVGSRYKKDFVLEFRRALKKLGLKQSDVIRRTMQEVIDKAKE